MKTVEETKKTKEDQVELKNEVKENTAKSWPSGHMMIAAMIFSLPMLSDVCKKRSMTKNLVCFALACVYIIIYGYNRIHVTNHFLSDVCFGTLITYLIFTVICLAFMKAVK